jgi:cephalosporin-C deacetylase-like acetyl esterase
MRWLSLFALALFAFRASAQDQSGKSNDDPRKMLHSYLLAEAQKHFDARRQVIAKLQTPDDIKKRQSYLKGKFLEALGGFPEKTPLNAKVVGTLKGDGFRVEKVIYESRPQHHVTANLYLPDGKAPFPGVLVPCGHSANGKAAEAYQRVCILMARHGMAVLCYDPIGQGERIQLLDTMGKPAIAGSTSEHTMVGIGALLVGQSTATYRIWDGIRSLDYLASRPDVDPKRLGCTGNSGGGTLTSYLMALDDRIVCAAPSCYLTTLERLFATIGPQDAEQNITGQLAFGMEHADYILMRAPKPTLMCVATQDFFDIGGARTTFQEATGIYRKMGAVRDVDFFEFDDKHGFSKPRREAAARWMKRWLVGVDEPISEGDFRSFKDDELQCTRSGQVLEDFKGKSAFHLNREYADALAKSRSKAALGSAEWRTRIETLIALKKRPPWEQAEFRAAVKALYESAPESWNGLSVRKAQLNTEPGIRAPVTLCSGKAKADGLVILLHEDGLDAAAGSIAKLVESGRQVAAVDLRGWGETVATKPASKKPGYFGGDFKESFLALHLNRPLLGQRVYDLLRVFDFFSVSHHNISIVAVGATGPVALHAAALDERIQTLTVERSLLSWTNVAQHPISVNQLTNVVPGALRAYDFPELAGSIAPRTLRIVNPVDSQLRPVSQAELDSVCADSRAFFSQKGAEHRLILRAEK